MNLYEISTNFCSVECNEITVTNCFLAGIIPSSESNVISYHLSEINNVEKTTDGSPMETVQDFPGVFINCGISAFGSCKIGPRKGC